MSTLERLDLYEKVQALAAHPALKPNERGHIQALLNDIKADYKNSDDEDNTGGPENPSRPKTFEHHINHPHVPQGWVNFSSSQILLAHLKRPAPPSANSRRAIQPVQYRQTSIWIHTCQANDDNNGLYTAYYHFCQSYDHLGASLNDPEGDGASRSAMELVQNFCGAMAGLAFICTKNNMKAKQAKLDKL
ncbi:hypothetical protein PGTUg99_011119 [Puccinia graminis f. sp. tritici]|uniref:Uncharacterized protein n=1 Tax=Puccinia graminis f. sp. tritici TaxID=56615 RepID=A0A5B0S2M4_PUCGR|nr:hypothetical protein PGTUg99_011119 [Puccinia graminis f. sp. tritici]